MKFSRVCVVLAAIGCSDSGSSNDNKPFDANALYEFARPGSGFRNAWVSFEAGNEDILAWTVVNRELDLVHCFGQSCTRYRGPWANVQGVSQRELSWGIGAQLVQYQPLTNNLYIGNTPGTGGLYLMMKLPQEASVFADPLTSRVLRDGTFLGGSGASSRPLCTFAAYGDARATLYGSNAPSSGVVSICDRSPDGKKIYYLSLTAAGSLELYEASPYDQSTPAPPRLLNKTADAPSPIPAGVSGVRVRMRETPDPNLGVVYIEVPSLIASGPPSYFSFVVDRRAETVRPVLQNVARPAGAVGLNDLFDVDDEGNGYVFVKGTANSTTTDGSIKKLTPTGIVDVGNGPLMRGAGGPVAIRVLDKKVYVLVRYFYVPGTPRKSNEPAQSQLGILEQE
jgi:hypothetical protein